MPEHGRYAAGAREDFRRGFEDGARDQKLGTVRQLCVTGEGNQPPIVKRDDKPYYHGYKMGAEEGGSEAGAWMRYRAKHRGRPAELRTNPRVGGWELKADFGVFRHSENRSHGRNPRGIYHEHPAETDDYVLRLHRGRVYVDRVGRGGTHLTIGPTRGYADAREAIRAIEDDAHIQDVRAAAVFNDDGLQLGSIEAGRFDRDPREAERYIGNARPGRPVGEYSGPNFDRRVQAYRRRGHPMNEAYALALAEVWMDREGWQYTWEEDGEPPDEHLTVAVTLLDDEGEPRDSLPFVRNADEDIREAAAMMASQFMEEE